MVTNIPMQKKSENGYTLQFNGRRSTDRSTKISSTSFLVYEVSEIHTQHLCMKSMKQDFGHKDIKISINKKNYSLIIRLKLGE